MKRLIAAVIISLALASCHKNTAAPGYPTQQCLVFPPFKPANFIVGRYDYPHLSNNLPLYPFFFTDNSKVYRQAQYFANGTPTISSLFSTSQPLPDSAVAVETALIRSFPAYLFNHPNTSIGLPSVPPMTPSMVLYVAFVTNMDTTTWKINMDTTTLPAEIRQYAVQMSQTITRLSTIH